VSDRRTTEPIANLPDSAIALKRACDKLRESQRILHTSHRRPDGDGTGTMAGLASLLPAQGKEAEN
jgi:nanoRNase/pAp phosphatase (c-di-AMP/oligoRNAs hydrolase)